MSEESPRPEPELLPSEWKMLAMHQRRDALFMVDSALPLRDVAGAVAADDTDQVRAWLEAGQLRRPSADEVARWDAEEGEHFLSAIVQPFVLAQRRQTPES